MPCLDLLLVLLALLCLDTLPEKTDLVRMRDRKSLYDAQLPDRGYRQGLHRCKAFLR
jgi:hypothetical protein